MLPNASERATEERHQEPPAAARPVSEAASEGTAGNLRALELENRDLMIASRVKDGIIEQLQKDRERLMTYQETLVEKMVDQSRMIGSLETRLLSLEAPREVRAERNPTVPNTPSMQNPSAAEPAVTPEPQPGQYREAQVEHPPSY